MTDNPLEVLERLEALDAKATKGPWMTEVGVHDDSTLHRTIRTCDKQPEHPWSARWIFWMQGSLGEWRPGAFPAHPKFVYCQTCKIGHYEWRTVPDCYRVDGRVDDDAYFVVALRNDALPALRSLAEANKDLAEQLAAKTAECERLREALESSFGALRAVVRDTKCIGGSWSLADGTAPIVLSACDVAYKALAADAPQEELPLEPTDGVKEGE